MRNPFLKRKKKLPSIVRTVVSGNGNTISGSISSIPSNLHTMHIGSLGSVGIGIQGPNGPQGMSGFTYASAATYSWFDPEEEIRRRKEELMKEFEQNPELFSEIIVELRQRKIRQLRDKSQSQP